MAPPSPSSPSLTSAAAPGLERLASLLPPGRLSVAVIDLTAVADNVAALRRRTGAELIAVVKADGYGHGLVPCARAALAGGAGRLGVAFLSEALALRAAGITAPVLAWITTPGQDYRGAVEAGVELGVGAPWAVQAVAAAARAAGRPAAVHLEADTGLGRGGATAAAWPELLGAVAVAVDEGTLRVAGTFSHFACADTPEHPSVAAQLAAYHEALATVERAGIEPGLRHLANSAAALAVPGSAFDAIRCGIAVYGLSPLPGRTPADLGLRPAMTLLARVAHTKDVEAGQGVSYGLTYRTAAAGRLALLPLGYGDGLPRHAGNRGQVLLAGRRRTVAGRVCMDQVVLDVGDEPVQPGDLAVVFGPGLDGEPTASDWAEAAGTIDYEIVTRIGARVPRVFLEPDPAPAGGLVDQ